MMKLLETGQALYVLAGICLLGILTRLMTRSLYKRLLKECTNLTVTKNKGLKELKLRAENTYRMNQGLRDSSAWLEHQLGELRFRGMTLGGWSGFSLQLTWLCLLGGGVGAFFSYWYRLDTSYIVMNGCGAVLMALLTMLCVNGAISGRREQRTSALQDYLENVLCPRLARSQSMEEPGMEQERGGRRLTVRNGRGGNGANVSRMDGSQRGKVVMMPEEGREETAGRGRSGGQSDGRNVQKLEAATEESGVLENREQFADSGSREDQERFGNAGARDSQERFDNSGGREDQTRFGKSGKLEHLGNSGGQGRSGGGRKRGDRGGRQETAAVVAQAEDKSPEDKPDIDDLKRSLEQIAASRERGRGSGDSWMKGLSPEQMQLIGDILKEYLG